MVVEICLLCLFLFHSYKSQTVVNNTWYDDMQYDSSGLNGWTLSNVVNGNIYQYHGWFDTSFNNKSLSRYFSCPKYASFRVNFSWIYKCDVENTEGGYVFINDTEILHPTYNMSNKAPTVLSNEYLQNCSNDMRELEMQEFSIIYNITVNAFESLHLSFVSALEDTIDEYIGITQIVIECMSAVPTPTMNPTYVPTIHQYIFIHCM